VRVAQETRRGLAPGPVSNLWQWSGPQPALGLNLVLVPGPTIAPISLRSLKPTQTGQSVGTDRGLQFGV